MPSQTFITSDTWTCPAEVFFVTAECWGCGGTSGPSAGTGGGGGGGGAYARTVDIPVTPGNNYAITAGVGNDGKFATTVIAIKGSNGSGGIGGIGGAAGGCTGAVKFSGGNGSSGAVPGGGGGSSAGTGANGTNAAGSTGAVAPAGGGNGGNGGPAFTVGTAGSVPGGGGGGGGQGGGPTSLGGAAQVILTWLAPDILEDSELFGPNIYFLDGTGMYGTDTTFYTTVASGNNVMSQVAQKWKGAYRGSLSGGFGGLANLAPGRWLAGTYSLALIGTSTINSYMTIGLPKTFGYDSNSTVAEQSQDTTLVFGFAIKSLGFSLDNQAPSFDSSLDDPQHWITIFDDYGQIMMVITTNTSGANPLKVYACRPGAGVQLTQANLTVNTADFDYIEVKIKFSETAGEVVIKQNGTEIVNYTGSTYHGGPKKARNITFGTISVANTARWLGQYTDFYVADGFVYSGHTSRVWVKPVEAQGAVKQWANATNSPSNHTHIDDNPLASGDYIYPSLPRRTIDTYTLTSETGIGLIHGVALNIGMIGAGDVPIKAVFWKVDSETIYPFSGYILGPPNYQVMQHINARIPYNEFYWKARDLGSGYGNIGIMYNE